MHEATAHKTCENIAYLPTAVCRAVSNQCSPHIHWQSSKIWKGQWLRTHTIFIDDIIYYMEIINDNCCRVSCEGGLLANKVSEMEVARRGWVAVTWIWSHDISFLTFLWAAFASEHCAIMEKILWACIELMI